jgi:hypothetical protein
MSSFLKFILPIIVHIKYKSQRVAGSGNSSICMQSSNLVMPGSRAKSLLLMFTLDGLLILNFKVLLLLILDNANPLANIHFRSGYSFLETFIDFL